MNTNKVIILARRHVTSCPENESSARLCLTDAVKLQSEGQLDAAKTRALKSLSYSVGIFHPDYQRAKK